LWVRPPRVFAFGFVFGFFAMFDRIGNFEGVVNRLERLGINP
jgi:hypothetical protein